MRSFTVETRSRTQLLEITGEVERALGDAPADGVAVVYVPHTTAGVTINERADPSVAADIGTFLDALVPWDGPYTHDEGNSAAHVKTTLVGSSVLVPFSRGALELGRWQGVFFCEFDGPRKRTVHVKVLAAT